VVARAGPVLCVFVCRMASERRNMVETTTLEGGMRLTWTERGLLPPENKGQEQRMLGHVTDVRLVETRTKQGS